MALNERELRLLNGIANTLRAIQKDIRAICDQQERAEQDDEVNPVWLDPILAAYQQAETNKTTSEDRNYRVQSSLRWAAWLAFIAAAIYGGLTYGTLRQVKHQADAMDTTLKETRINFRTDERAWLEIDSIKKQIFPPEGQFPTTFKYQVFLKNVGKTIAKDAILRRVSSFGPIPNESGVKLSQKERIRQTNPGLRCGRFSSELG